MLVTGGNRGIGRAIAEAFVAQGDRVAVTTRSGGAPAGCLDVRCDITDPAAVEAAFVEFLMELSVDLWRKPVAMRVPEGAHMSKKPGLLCGAQPPPEEGAQRTLAAVACTPM